MGFKKNKLKYEGRQNIVGSAVRMYRYGNTTICRSQEAGPGGRPYCVVSFSSIPGKMMSGDEINGILEYLGIDLTRPMTSFASPYAPSVKRTRTQYYQQEMRTATA